MNDELILKGQEFKENIAQIVNSSGLPAIIVRPILKDLLEQVTIQEQLQFEQAYLKREEKVKSEEKKKAEAKEAKKDGKDTVQKPAR